MLEWDLLLKLWVLTKLYLSSCSICPLSTPQISGCRPHKPLAVVTSDVGIKLVVNCRVTQKCLTRRQEAQDRLEAGEGVGDQR